MMLRCHVTYVTTQAARIASGLPPVDTTITSSASTNSSTSSTAADFRRQQAHPAKTAHKPKAARGSPLGSTRKGTDGGAGAATVPAAVANASMPVCTFCDFDGNTAANVYCAQCDAPTRRWLVKFVERSPFHADN